jgi:endoribonuclease LACTB2
VYVQSAKEAILAPEFVANRASGGDVTTVRRVTRSADITAVHFSTARSRLVGYGVYVFLTRGTLIDCAFHAVRRDVSTLLDELRPAGVLLTHQHEDHAGNADLVARRGLPIGAATRTFDAIRSVTPIGFYRRLVWSSMPPLRAPVDPHAPAGLSLIHAPGHSPDHHVIWDAERETLFAGDLYLSVKVRVARPGEEPRVLARSLRAIADLHPRRMLDSHRGEIDRPREMLLAKASWLDETIGRIDQLSADGRSERAILTAVMGREDPIAYVSGGDLSRRNFVRAVLRGG